jgi:hypothetical protein
VLLRATSDAVALFPISVGVIDGTMEMAAVLGVSVETPSEADVSLGRLEGLTSAVFDRTIGRSEEWQQKVDSMLPGARRGHAPGR